MKPLSQRDEPPASRKETRIVFRYGFLHAVFHDSASGEDPARHFPSFRRPAPEKQEQRFMKSIRGQKGLIEVDDQRDCQIVIQHDPTLAARVVKVRLGLHGNVAQRLARAIEWASWRKFHSGSRRPLRVLDGHPIHLKL